MRATMARSRRCESLSRSGRPGQRRGHDHAARLSQSQVGRNLGLPVAVAERRARGIPARKERLAGNLLGVMEAIQAAQHTQAVVDGLRRGRGVFVELVTDIVEQKGVRKLTERVARTLEPTCQVE